MAFIRDFLDLTVRGDTELPSDFSDALVADVATEYFKASAVDTALSYLTGSLSKCEIKTLENGAEVKGDLYFKLNIQPNPNQNASQFITKLVTKLVLEGEALIVKLRDNLYVADSFAIERHALGRNTFSSIVVEQESIRRHFLSDKVCYFQYGNHRVKTLINGMWQDYARLLTNAFDGFAQHAGSKYKLTFEAPMIGNRNFQKIDDAERFDPSGPIKRFMKEANSVFIQHQGYDLEQFVSIPGVSSEEIVRLRKEQFELVASIFKIPPPMIFGNMTNMTEITKQFLTYAIEPISEQIGRELTAKFYEPKDIENGSRVNVDTTRISHIDIFDIAPAISALIGSGFSLDEVRDATGWQRIGTEESQEHLITKNYGPLEEVLAAIATAGAPREGVNQ